MPGEEHRLLQDGDFQMMLTVTHTSKCVIGCKLAHIKQKCDGIYARWEYPCDSSNGSRGLLMKPPRMFGTESLEKERLST